MVIVKPVAAWTRQAKEAMEALRAANSGQDPANLRAAAAIGHQFHPDYGVVLRGVLFAVDRHQARAITGCDAETTGQSGR